MRAASRHFRPNSEMAVSCFVDIVEAVTHISRMSRSLVTFDRAAIELALIGVTGHSVADVDCC